MENTKRGKGNKLSVKIWGILLSFCMIVAMLPPVFAAAEDDVRKLQNGSFEKHSVTSWSSGSYAQVDQSKVDNWKTTAYNTNGNNGLIELFKVNSNTYLKNPSVTLKPSDGEVAAELNADEESSLYQVVHTTASSIYEWGLDHGARTSKDIMALVIGPAQSENPSKPNKAGQDQLMQMVKWLNIGTGVVPGNEPLHRVVYSKKFAANGTFENNAGNNAFSLTPSTIYTEEWHIWVMASARGQDSSENNPWNSYGSNAGESAASTVANGNTVVDMNKYYLYTVPAGQNETLFAFVSISSEGNGPTYGNFLDNINFQLYHPLSGSSTTHGSAVIGSSDGSAEGGNNGTTEGESGSKEHTVTVNNKLVTYVTDGEPLKIQAIVKNAGPDAENPTYDGCEFVGVYYTTLGENGNAVTSFIKLDTTNGWTASTDKDGNLVYTYDLENVSSATDLHFIFIKSPTITYDPNGGKPYDVGKHYDIKDGKNVENVYSFKPAEEAVTTGKGFVEPYISHAAEGQNDGWKFMGWKLTGDTVPGVPDSITKVNSDYLGERILPAEHTVACNYYMDGASNITAAQYFKIYEEKLDISNDIEITKKDTGEVSYIQWGKNNSSVPDYGNVHRGLTMVAQWRWRQAFIPQTVIGGSFQDSSLGGSVEIVGVTNENYGAGKAYYATTDEIVTATATANKNYTFEGWYDEAGNLLTASDTYSYIETKESVKTFYARFSGSVTQTYIRQVKNGDTWVDTTDDNIGTLDRYTYTDAPGTNASSTATEGAGYKFVGWYDSDGNKVVDSMLISGGATISYATTVDATYYARFETAYTVKFAAQTQQDNGSFKTDTVGGKVSVASVKDVDGKTASSKATANSGYKFLGWYDKDGNLLSTNATYSTTTTSATNNVTYYARFAPIYTVNFVAQTKQANGSFENDNSGGTVSPDKVTGQPGASAQSTATANSGYNFLGWYDKNGNQLSTDATYSTTTTSATNGVTYYARFESVYTTSVDGAYVAFVSESEDTEIPSVFEGRHAGIHRNTERYGKEDKFGNTISTGFQYSIGNMDDVSTIQITVTVPADSYVKVGGTGKFSGNGTSILTDSDSVIHNKGSIQQISGATTLTYYWDATDLSAGQTYGFIIDNLYAPGATARITINGREGTQVTSVNGVVNTASGAYRANSRYPQ